MLDSFDGESGLVDSAPLDNFILDVIGNKTLKRKLITGAVDVGSGQFIQLDSDHLNPDEWHKAVVASGSVPGIFPTTKLRNWSLMDGGTVWNINPIGAINKCKELGVKDE